MNGHRKIDCIDKNIILESSKYCPKNGGHLGLFPFPGISRAAKKCESVKTKEHDHIYESTLKIKILAGLFFFFLGSFSPLASTEISSRLIASWTKNELKASGHLFFLKREFSPGQIAPLLAIFPQQRAKNDEAEIKEESWHGIYVQGQKVGYGYSCQRIVVRDHRQYVENYSESKIKVSRLGGVPIEINTRESIFYDREDNLQKVVVETTMTGDKISLEAQVKSGKIVFFAGGKQVNEVSSPGKFYAEIPIKKLLDEGKIQPGYNQDFLVIDPLTYSLKTCHFEVLGWEEVMILGEKKSLCHTRTKMETIVSVTVDDWLDEEGIIWKSINNSAFLTMTSLRMNREKALEPISSGFDLAYSTIIRPNVAWASPYQITRVRFRLSGLEREKFLRFPFDDGSQQLVQVGDDFVVVQTNSLVFKEKRALALPIKEEKIQSYLQPTTFCQSDDPQIQNVARDIIGDERNSWRAAKLIARWVNQALQPNYDVGFASAREVLKARQGDCSEFTVLTVALCRAVGIPARAAVGIMSAGGLFAYHMWPEVYVGRWLNLDPKWLVVDKDTGELVTDATHLKFGRSRLDENLFKEIATSVAEIIGHLELEIIDYLSSPTRQQWVEID